MDIRPATTVAELLAAGHLFDAPPREEWAARFLAAEGHVLLIAYVDGVPAGFVSGIEMLHPDKGTEMCLYELAVDDPFRRRGIGGALTRALVDLARERGCYDVWVGVEPDNEAALATYRSAGAGDDGRFAMLVWEFGGGTEASQP
ncbi:GNAT family N-acetyltransferase [Streptomyces filamentosus]|uniref:GNAT family N-acetyltransferase n=1 Tax=Streptomyces filamentosus TaxID=67294 RepID=A0ABY4UZD3_STRFL|nr:MULTISPECIES: GNAT family N-acetyltransferase [Streptomyces]MYR78725.1 GNAT family N-acetyltransferase [Streptomyces sp. SID5466]EWS91705.1 aminoglycoside 6'-N-acetyltransferase [Streptomyces filamentosus NRRL 11379]NUV69493.1 GNAT family N-acetyltransferase [Streptomyces sp. CAI-121]NUW02015.1 GNAT family N-acetyltransferase [Streptomyces sp. CAI 127]NUW15636.1 GNAT family N-acetyltransferase [Streptomyces sp. CAI-68]